MPEPIVVDSSAVLAFIYDEPGQDVVTSVLTGALFSTVNVAEVHTKLILEGVPADFAWKRILALNCQICEFSEPQARFTGELVRKTRPFGLSLGDRACLSLAIERKATVYTTDRAWKNLDLPIAIEVIR